MAKTTPGKITLWALESDYDAKAIEIMAHKILDGKGATATIQARGRPERNIAKRGRKGLEQAVGNYLRENRRVIFILDRDGPMSKAERQKEPNSLARLCLRPLIHHLFLPSLVLGPGILLRDDVRVVITSHVIPAGNAGT
uniref:Uncharacterized protein n=1 Tax=Candidatus Kentrum sp. FW TaxID=2126338 RepID=A0A450T7F9_9GAMM|nr:MAG: hypothetical protein BECKFW1821A_GA0114235_11334 [Candidatus Kentron sp. FW]